MAFFIPVLIGSGGNTGTQSAILVIRAIAIGDLGLRKWFSVVKKELLVGLLLGGYAWSRPLSVELFLEGRSSGGPNSLDVNGYNHLMGKFSWGFIADNFDKNET